MLHDRTLPSSRTRSPGRWLWLIASAGGGALAFLGLAARLPGFWHLSRWPRAATLAAGGILLALIFGALLRAAWRYLFTTPRLSSWIGLGIAIGLGMLLRELLPAPALPLLYTLQITTPGASAQSPGPVTLLELRDPAGRVVPMVDFSLDGAWQRSVDGLAARSDQPARLRYSFYAPARGSIQVLLGEQPGGGVLQLDLSGSVQQVSLDGPSGGQRLIEIPFQKSSRWELPIQLADLALGLLFLPALVFVLSLAAVDGARRYAPAAQAASRNAALRLEYPGFFVAAFILLLVLPLVDYHGSLLSITKDFFGYPQLYRAYSDIRYRVFGDRLFDKVLVGDHNWMVLADRDSMNNYQRIDLFTNEELFQIQQRIDGTRAYLEQRGIRFLLVITPNKNTIYADRVPGQIQVMGQQSRLDQLLEYQKTHGTTPILDLRPALLQARKSRELFYATDTHWNPDGAYVGYAEIIKALHKDFPNLPLHALDEYRQAPEPPHLGDLARTWVPGAPLEYFFQLEPVYPRQVHRLELLDERKLYSFQYNNLAAPQLPRAVVYHDSFMPWMYSLLTDSFSKVTYIWTEKMNLELVESEKPDVVIYECTERFLNYLLTLPITH